MIIRGLHLTQHETLLAKRKPRKRIGVPVADQISADTRGPRLVCGQKGIVWRRNRVLPRTQLR